MPEIRIPLSDEEHREVERAAAARHVDPAEYVRTVLAHDTQRTLFIEGAQAFIGEHAAGFAEHFGTGRGTDTRTAA